MLGLFFGMLSMGVYTTVHFQTSCRLVQELNVCTVGLCVSVPVACVLVITGESLSSRISPSLIGAVIQYLQTIS